MVGSIPLRAGRLSKSYRDQQSIEASAEGGDTLRRAMAWQNPEGGHWVRMSPPSAADQLFARHDSDRHTTYYIILTTKPEPRCLWLNNDYSIKRMFYDFGSVP